MKKTFVLVFWLLVLTVFNQLKAEILLTSSVILQPQYFPSVIKSFNDQYNNYSDEYIESALSYARLAYIAQFPTAATSFNISNQCKEDSQIYFHSYKAQKNWALKSS